MEPYDFDDLWNYGDPAGTAEKFQALMPHAERRGDPEYALQLKTQLARTHALRREFDAAHALLDDVEAQMGPGTPVARIRLLLERGRTYNSAGEKAAALPLFKEAWEQARTFKEDFYAVDAAHMIAIASGTEEALSWNMRAIEYAEASKNERARGWLGSLLNNTGWTYHDMGKYETALELFERALAFRLEQGQGENIRIARWCIARCLRSLDRLDEALEIQQDLLAEGKAAGDSLGYTHEELGELLLLKGRHAEARPHFADAYTALSRDAWMMANETERMARLKRLAEADDPGQDN